MGQVPLGPAALLPRYARLALSRGGGRQVPQATLRHDAVVPDPAHVARYASLVGDPATEHLPLLYPHLLGFDLQLALMSDGRFPARALGLVHLCNEVITTGLIRRGEPLGIAVHAVGPRPHPKGRLFDFVTEVDAFGETVWTEVSSYLARGPSESGVGEDEAEPAPRPAWTPSAKWRLPAALGRRYALLSGDVNPIHLYPWSARALGFPRQIVHGMWTAAAVAGALANRVPEAVTYRVEFHRPLVLPGTVWLDTALTGGGAHARIRRGEKVALSAAFTPGW